MNISIRDLPKEVQKEIREKARLEWLNSSLEGNRKSNGNKMLEANTAKTYGGWVNKYKKLYLDSLMINRC
jgi:hypothetical protein